MTARPDPRVGTDLGSYRIEAVLGRGGMGIVYLAEQQALGRKVALKLLPDALAEDATFRQRFERESRLAASIDHRNIIPIYEAGEVEGVVFLAMRYVDGTDLANRLSDGPLAPATTLGILAQVASALDAAHARGLVHRDVKPANILLAKEPGAPNHVYLTDFGLTKQASSQTGMTVPGGFLGTLAYVAPEQIDGRDVDGRADQYALAVTAFECLTGHVPFFRDTEIAVAMAHLKDPVPSAVELRRGLPPGVDAVLARALAKDPEARYPDCGAFVEDLGAAVGGAEIPAAAHAAPRKRTTAILGASALGFVAVVGVAMTVSLGVGRGESTPGPSQGSAARGTAAPSPATSASPAEDEFPTADEADLLAMLPADLRPTCVRGGGVSDATTSGYTGTVKLFTTLSSPDIVNVTPPTPTASLVCSPVDGAARAYFLWYRFLTADNTTDYLGRFALRYQIPDGDCAKAPAKQPWSNELGASGSVVCLPTAPFDGSPWIDWTFADSHGLAFATRDDRDFEVLDAWFRGLRTFLR